MGIVIASVSLILISTIGIVFLVKGIRAELAEHTQPDDSP